MSLRAFHLFFIACAVALAAFFAVWASDRYQVVGGVEYLAAAAAAMISGTGLAVYGAAFQRRTRRL